MRWITATPRQLSTNSRLFSAPLPNLSSGGGLTVLAFFLAVCLSTSGVHISSPKDSSSQTVPHPETVVSSDELRDAVHKGITAPIQLPTNFEERVQAEMKMGEGDSGSRSQRHGDPAPIPTFHPRGPGPRPGPEVGRGANQGRGFFSFWPFSIEITKGKGHGPGFDHGGVQGGWGGGHHGPPSKSGFGLYKGITFKAASHHHKGHDHGHDEGHHGGGGHHDHKPSHGWGWEAAIEKEKHQLRYEILKLKAKKKIALLQNTVELKKLFSIILQKIVQALEWWR